MVEVVPKAPLAHCDECPLKHQPFVPGFGPQTTDRVLVGEAPANTEVLEGQPFVGIAGRRLNQSLAASGVDRSGVYITNSMLCQLLPEMKQGSAKRDRAVNACHDRLVTEIRSRLPRKVLGLGTASAQTLTGISRPTITELRGQDAPSPYLAPSSELRVTYHPSALNRYPEWRARFDEDVGWLE